MTQYDYIVIGAGMGGLSVANFLAKYGKSVLVLEKHDKAGGLCTSFKRKGAQFDLGIECLHELEPKGAIPQFFAFWGGEVKNEKHTDTIRCYIDDDIYHFQSDKTKEDFLAQFPNDTVDIEKLFFIIERVVKDMFNSDHPPIPPYDMNVIELIRFGIENMRKKPFFMK